MFMTDPSLIRVFSYIGDRLSALFLSPGSIFSLTSLLCALGVATLVIVWRRLARHRRISVKFLLRALFPKRLVTSPSTRADLFCLAANVFVYGAILVAAVLSTAALAGAVAAALASAFGPTDP